jgi:hypothetical protein
MNCPTLIATAALGLTMALPAAASPAFDGFKAVCGDTHLDFAAVKSAADAGHWVPTEVQSSTMEGVTVTEFAWHGTKGAVQVSGCTVRVSPGKFADLAHDAGAWAGFAPQVSSPSKSVWQFTENAGAIKAVQKTEYNAAAAAAGLDFFTVTAAGSEAILDLLKIKS